jgi:DNA-binding NtrC family response regulator
MADRILIVDDEEIIRNSISFILAKEGFSVQEAENGLDAYRKLQVEPFDLIVTDLEMPEMKGLELLEKAMHLNPQSLVVIVTAYGSLETAIAALRNGASDYILKPIEFDELIVKIRRLLGYRRLQVENQMLRRELNRSYDFSNLVGKSPAMQKVFETIQRVAPTDSTVLITGKSGTGKELVARAVHFNSSRSEKPFVAVNCGAIPDTLIESELFGHKKGAFTGAIADKIGYFKAADGGTLFLDEISEMPLQLQVKLLRVVEQREVALVGSSIASPIDVRILASTNRDLGKEVDAGRFRQDLYYRLNVVEIRLPSLAERTVDIPPLVQHFVDKYRNEMKKNIRSVDSDAMLRLMQHDWKGEVRELENVIERAVIFADGETITINDLPGFVSSTPGQAIAMDEEPASLEDAMNAVEKQYILASLRKHNLDKERTAHALKISLPTLYRRIKDLEIQLQ